MFKQQKIIPYHALGVRTRTLLTLLLVFGHFGAKAQEYEDTGSAHLTTLPSITVTGESESEAPQSLFRMSLQPREIPQSVSVIDEERIEQQGLIDLDDVMAQATGVTVQTYEDLTTSYYVRGFRVDSFETDGVPAGFGSQASSPQDLAIYERVEILRGANGLLHGSGNPAATVNLVRKMPMVDRHIGIKLIGGSWDRYRGEFDAGGPINDAGTLRGRVVAAYEDRDFFNDFADRKTGLLYGVLEADLSDRTKLTFGAQYQDIKSTTDMAGVPMAADGADLGLSRSTYLNADWSRFDWTTHRAFGALEHELGRGWQAKLSLEYEKTESILKYAGVYGTGINAKTGVGAILYPGAHRFKTEYTSADLNLNGPFSLFGREHQALVGVSYGRRGHRMKTGAFDTNIMQPVNVYTWDPRSIPEPGVVGYSLGSDDTTTEKGLYAMGRFSLSDPLTFVLGSRLSQWEQTTLNDNYKPDSQLVPYAGLIWDVNSNWSTYVSYAGVFQPQTQLTYDGGILDPMKGHSYEVGVKGAFANEQFHVSAALFRIDQKDRAQADPDHPGIGQATYYINGGKVRSQGFELETNGNLTPNWNIYAGYTYTDTEYIRDQDNQGRAFSSVTPKHVLKFWTNYTLPWQERRWSVGAGLHMQSSYTKASNQVTLRQGGYTTVNMRAGYRINPQWDVAFNVNNLFDKRYYQSFFGTAWSNRYGAPRNVMATLRGSF